MILSSEYLSEYMNSLDECSMQVQINEMLARIAGQKRLDSINKVNSFFQSNTFKGFVMNVKTSLNEKPFDFEVFVTPTRKKTITETVTEITDANKFLDLVSKFEVSTDYDSKEQMFYSNYASIIGQTSNPTLMLAIDSVPEDFNFTFVWKNSNGRQFDFFITK